MSIASTTTSKRNAWYVLSAYCALVMVLAAATISPIEKEVSSVDVVVASLDVTNASNV